MKNAIFLLVLLLELAACAPSDAAPTSTVTPENPTLTTTATEAYHFVAGDPITAEQFSTLPQPFHGRLCPEVLYHI